MQIKIPRVGYVHKGIHMVRIGEVLKKYIREVEEDERVDSSGRLDVKEEHDNGQHTEESGEPEHVAGERGHEA